MNILHVVPYFNPAWSYGGPPRAVYEIARRQARLGHKVSVLTTTAYDKYSTLPEGTTEIEGVIVHRVRNLSNKVMWQFHFCTPIGASMYLRQSQFDVIHLHEVRTLLTYLALLYGRTKKFCLSPWGTLPYNSSLVTIKRVIDLILMPLLQQKVVISFAQTEHELRQIVKFCVSSEQKIVPLGIDIDSAKNLPRKQTARKKLKLDENAFYFTFLGRFSPYKGLDLLLQSFKSVSLKYSDARLLLVGRDDGYLTDLKKSIKKYQLQKKVQILPPLYDSERFFAYRAADCFVFTPSVYEETGTVCLEALASGIPVITTKQASIPFLQKKDGVTEVNYSVSEVKNAMITAMTSTQTVDMNLLTQQFSWDKIAVNFTKEYR